MKRQRITTVQALNMLLLTERALARVQSKAAPDEDWRAAREALNWVRRGLEEHVRAAITARRVR